MKGEFYNHPKASDGKDSSCKHCRKDKVNANRLAKLEYYTSGDRMKEIGLVTLITEKGDDIVLEAFTDIDKAHERQVELCELSGGDHFYVQYVELY